MDEMDEMDRLVDDLDDDGEPIDDDEGLIARAARVLRPSRMLRTGELSGCLGDLGTFLPDVVALSQNRLSPYPYPASFVFFSGLWNLASGIYFDLPLPIQPMHTVTAVSLTEGLSYAQTVASGIWLGLFFLALGATGMIGALKRAIPLAVVRGLQLGLGLKVIGTGVGLTLRAKQWVAGGFDGRAVACVSAAIALGCYADRKRPASLILFALGCVGVVLAAPPIELSLPRLPLAPMPSITADDWWAGLYRAALPQLPVTLLNAVVSTAKLAEDLYPRRRTPGVGPISLSIAAMDLSSCPFGHFPSCHGCGGLAGQHHFGARTGSSMALIGIVKMAVAVLLSGSLVGAFAAFPSSVLGVLLAVSGIELAACCHDISGKFDMAVMLIGAGVTLKVGTGAAFLAAAAAAAVFRLARRDANES